MFALIDCNSFFASCERVFDPSLRNTPVAVLSNNDGCVIARTQEVKDLGVPMGAPLFKWKDLFEREGVKYFSSNYVLYSDMSNRVMQTIKAHCGAVEVYSIDEAFVTLHTLKTQKQRMKFCRALQQKIYQHTGIPVCIGIGKTKVLAKAANRVAKNFNREVHEVTEENHEKLLKWLKVGDVWGVGRKSSEKLGRHGIRTAYQLIQKEDKWIKKELSIVGLRLVHELRGNSCLFLEEIKDRRKNILCSRSFGSLVEDLETLGSAVSSHASRAAEKLREDGSVCQAIQLFIRTSQYREQDLQYSAAEIYYFSEPTCGTTRIIKGAQAALKKIYKKGFKYKKCGVMVFGLSPNEGHPMSLFTSLVDRKSDLVDIAMDQLNNRYGKGSLSYGYCQSATKWKMISEHKSQEYSTKWEDLLVV